MKFAWRPKINDLVGYNSKEVEEVQVHLDDLNEYTEMLDVDESAAEFDRFEDEFIILD